MDRPLAQGAAPPPSPAAHGEEARRIVRSLLRFGAWFAALWAVFFAIWSALPGLRAGHVQIYEATIEAVKSGHLFPDGTEIRVVIFGSSKVQAGFVPDTFDALSRGQVASYNLGLPNTTTFIDELETLVARDAGPTHVFLTRPWETEYETSAWGRLLDDEWMIKRLFPFRLLPRDLVLFTIRSFHRGGPLAFYRTSIDNVRRSKRQRGYFFVEEMSHFPGHRLPDDFRLESDMPERTYRREARPAGHVFQRLTSLAGRGGFNTYLVPGYRRIGEAADAVPNPSQVEALANHGIRVLGPDYWLLPNRFFSDPVHLNPEGAHCYTKLLWELFAPEITNGSAPSASPVSTSNSRSTRPSCT